VRRVLVGVVDGGLALMSAGKRVLLAIAYAGLCLAEFLIGWAKEWIEKQLKGEEPKT
jgi:hypothetical protein